MNIIWDFDGTIVDSYKLFVSIFKSVLGDRFSEKQILSQLKVSFSHAVSYFKLSDHQLKEVLKQEKLLGPKQFELFPNIERVFALADHNFIVTHNSREVVVEVLEEHNLTDYFTRIIGIEDEFPRKPDVQAYQSIMKDYPIDMVIGDRDLDLIPAKKLGITTCSFQNDRYSPADYTVQNYDQLYQLLIKQS